MKLACLSVLVVGCSTSSTQVLPDASAVEVPVDARSDFNASGTRIKLRYLETSDGAKMVTGTHDVLRGEDCTFLTASDGMTRCIPAFRIAAVYYSDSLCTQPALALPTCEAPPKYLAALGQNNCPSAPLEVGPEIYTRGAAMSGAYRINSLNNSCIATGTTPEITYYALGTQIEATEFALATPKTEP